MAKTHTLMTERIIAALAKGPCNKVELRNEVVGRHLTYQGFYKAFAKLKADEVIIVHRTTASLSLVWLEKERERIERTTETYNLSGYRSYFGGLKKGSKLNFRFKTLRELDLFWTQAVLVAIQGAHRNAAILSFIPHDWFDLLRPSTSDVWFKLLGKRNPHVNVITHAAPEEKKLSEHLGVTRIESMSGINPLKQKESLYINVIDELIFEAVLDESVLSGIRRAMRGEGINVEKLINQPGTFKFLIMHNPAKALVLKKKAQKYFSIRLFN